MAVFPTPHTARRREYVERQGEPVEWVEGEPGADGPQPVDGPEFPCFLFLPLGSEDEAHPRSRKVSRPTVMWDPAEVVGDNPTADDELLIVAPELAPVLGAGEVRWQVDGAPQPFGPPGEQVVGVQATLKRVEG